MPQTSFPILVFFFQVYVADISFTDVFLLIFPHIDIFPAIVSNYCHDLSLQVESNTWYDTIILSYYYPALLSYSFLLTLIIEWALKDILPFSRCRKKQIYIGV